MVNKNNDLRFKKAQEAIVVDPLYDSFGIRHENIVGISSVGETLPFHEESFDFIILRNVIDHMLYPKDLLKESYRILKQNGKVYFMVNIFLPVLKPLFPLMNILDKAHPIHFTKNQVKKLLFDDIKFYIKREKVKPNFHFEWRLKRLVGMIIKMEYYAVLEKQ